MNYAMYYLPNILFSVMEGDLVKLKEKVKELDGIIDNMEGKSMELENQDSEELRKEIKRQGEEIAKLGEDIKSRCEKIAELGEKIKNRCDGTAELAEKFGSMTIDNEIKKAETNSKRKLELEEKVSRVEEELKALKIECDEHNFYKDDIIRINKAKELVKTKNMISLLNCNVHLQNSEKMEELKAFLTELNKPTFIIATEIRTNRVNLNVHEVKVQGYEGPFFGSKDERKRRTRQGSDPYINPSKHSYGGVAIWIKNDEDVSSEV